MSQIRKRRLLLSRLLIYGAGGMSVSLVVNPALFWLFHEVIGWNNYGSYALSLAILNVIQFLWNYFIGFRTRDHWTTALRRQIVILCIANAANYALVVVLQGVFPDWKKLVIVAVQIGVAVCKFLAYHFWVYPADRSATNMNENANSGGRT